MTPSLVVFLGFAALAASYRQDRKGQFEEARGHAPSPVTDAPQDGLEEADPTPTPTPILECSDFVNVSVRGKDYTNVVKTVCNFWPVSQFGPFPMQTVVATKDLLQNVFNEGGMWDQFMALMGEKNEKYCLRQEVTRTLATSLLESGEEVKECPEVLSTEILEEMPGETTSHADLLDGYWACGNHTDAHPTSCQCTRRDQLVDDIVYPAVSIASRPVNCHMVQNGVCYGACPAGYRPTFLIGWFRPVCTSVCASTNYPVTCGIGCANTRSDCVAIIMNQVKEVAIAASKVASFFIGGVAGVALHSTVESVVRVAEFAFNVLSKVLVLATEAFKQFAREQAGMATLVTLYQTLVDAVTDIGKDWVAFQPIVSQTVKLFTQLIDAEFGWTNVDLGWISGVVMKNGVEALAGAYQVAKAFAFQRCELATNEVAFSIEQIGDLRVIGAWSQDGSTNGKPRYRLIRDRANTVLEWSRRGTSWSIYYLDKSFGRGSWFGWMGLGWRELYRTFSDSPEFPRTGWLRNEGPLPLPHLISAKDGGES